MKGVAMKKFAALAVAALVVALVGIVTAAASPPDELQAVQAATARYHSFVQAQADGYTIADEPCVAAPGLGAMGIHAVNPALIADPAINPTQPEILLYLPQANGGLELIGVEYFKVDADQNLATDDDRPSVLGQPFDGPMLGHNPTMPIHYDLHLWFWADNPAGFFAPFNPNLSCPS
jgi:hypothetical protein